MRLASSALVCAMLSVLLVGCGDDGAPADDVWDDEDQCLSAQDRTIVEPWKAGRVDAGVVDGGVGDGGTEEALLPGQIVGACVRTSAAMGDDYDCFEPLVNDRPEEGRACVNDCLDESELSPLTQGCRDCFIDWIFCGGTSCAVPCLADNATECENCLFDACGDQLDICIGY